MPNLSGESTQPVLDGIDGASTISPEDQFDPYDPTIPEDRRRHEYDAYRAKCPVKWQCSHGGYYLISGFEAVRGAALDTDRFQSSDGVFLIDREGLPRVPALEYDEPEHSMWRKLMNDLLSMRSVREAQPMVTDVVERQIDRFAGRGQADLVADYAHPVPAIVIGRLVGLDYEDSLQSQTLAESTFAAIGQPDFAEKMEAFAKFTLSQLHERRSHPRNDFLSALASGSYDGLEVDDGIALQTFVGLLGGGFHSTASGISGLIHHVLTVPGLRERVAYNEEDLRSAIEESLRLTTPLQLFARTVTADTELVGVKLAGRSRALLNYAAANRDPEAFSQPNTFDVDRRPNRHLAFGIGRHLCVGQHLARVELRIAMSRLLARLPDIELVGRPQLSGLVTGQLMNTISLKAGFSPQPI